MKLTTYHKKLLVFLSVATFFEGYDFIALTQLLPNLRRDMDLSPSEGGLLVAFINLGTMAAFFLVRRADKWGRRRMLTITIAGYTLFTLLSGLSPGVKSFAFFQFAARMFLVAEWAISMVFAAEEFPDAYRGTVIGVIQGFSSLGAICCAGLVPLMLDSPWGWRTVYFVGVVPLLLLAVGRRSLRESQRFEDMKAKAHTHKRGFLAIWSTPYRKRLLKLSVIWALTYLCTQNAVTFWKEFAVDSRGWSDADVAQAISIAAVGSMPFVFYAGRLLDKIGRRLGALVIFGVTIVGVLGCYGLHGRWALTAALAMGIFGANGVLPVLNAYTTELFPTEWRADAFAWSNNVLGRIGYVISPAGVGALAAYFGSWGPAVQLTVVGPLAALALIFLWLPETKSKTLEDTAKV